MLSVTSLVYGESNLNPNKKEKAKILIFIKPDLYNSLRSELKTYLKDVEKDGYLVEVKTKDWETANEIKNVLKQEWKNGLQGCILIGDIPYALIKRSEEEEEEDDEEEKLRPSPLFYMDLDGKWEDSGNNGYYDILPDWPEIAPEIWVGRITAHTLDGEETLHIKNYFKKVYLYRRGMLQVKKKALSFVDDKWIPHFPKPQTLGLDKIYGTEVVILNDKEVSTAERFKSELKEEYEFIHVITHNNDGYTGHGFEENSSLNEVSFEDIQEIKPKTLFYNLGVCSNGYFIKDNYMGGWYLFGPGNGLIVIGTTMPGMMLSSSFFYDRLSKGESFGESLKKWYKKEIPRDRKATNRKWYLGIALLGDPTLIIQKVAKPREEVKPKEKPKSRELTQEDKARTIYSLGENYQLNRMYPQAIREYQRVIKKYPSTIWATKARKQLKKLK